MTRTARPVLARAGRGPALLGVLAVGLLARLALAATTAGNRFDLRSLALVAERLRTGTPWHLYGDVNTGGPFLRWPYPPGYLPVLRLVDLVAGATGLPFGRLVRLVPVTADLVLAVVVHRALARQDRRQALLAAAAVALGPTFLADSGHHGQLDSVAALPAALAVVAWQRGGGSRAPLAGLLLGLGAAVKTWPVLLVVALLATARDRREAAHLLVPAAAVPLVLLLPFLLADPGAVVHALSYRGLPGLGGLSLLVQPSLAAAWLAGDPVRPGPLLAHLQPVVPVLLLLGLGLLAARLRRARVPAAPASCAVVALALLLGGNYALGYAVWLLPLLLLAGWTRAVVGLQVLLLVPTLLVYGAPARGGLPAWTAYVLYVPLMLVLQVGLVLVLRRAVRARTPVSGTPTRGST